MIKKSGMVAHAFNPRTLETEEKLCESEFRQRVLVQPG